MGPSLLSYSTKYIVMDLYVVKIPHYVRALSDNIYTCTYTCALYLGVYKHKT